MAKSAIYSFTGKKVGLVKDTTIYNGQYVKVAIYSGKGEFTGGYNSSGNFDWLLTSGSSALARSDTSVVNTAYSLYEADVNVNGFVTLYAP